MMSITEKRTFLKIYLFQPGLRIWHWIQFLCIVVLFVTGLYIGNPFFIGSASGEPTTVYPHILSMDLVRLIHFSAGYVLLVAFLYRIFLLFTKKAHRALLAPKYLGMLKDVILTYVFIKKSYPPMIRNPLARLAYIFIFALLVFQIWTGFAMYGLSDPNGTLGTLVSGWTVALFGSEFTLHVWHRIVSWVFFLFLIFHVYLVFYNAFLFKEGELASMASGNRWVPLDRIPMDAEDALECKLEDVLDHGSCPRNR